MSKEDKGRSRNKNINRRDNSRGRSKPATIGIRLTVIRLITEKGIARNSRRIERRTTRVKTTKMPMWYMMN